ncbi:hypothetical protein HOY82DRAFT_671769 [Tuber indicum]|nr:hypothetical protein HOY82DRAFT_671769 [Tuber indicum]
MSIDPGSWIGGYPNEGKYRNAHPLITNKNPDGFTYPAGEAPFELIFRHNTILYTLLPLLSTPSMVSVFFVSNSTKHLLADMTPFFRNLAFVPDTSPVKWIYNEKFDFSPEEIPSPLCRALVDFREQRERGKVDFREGREMIGRYLSDTLGGTDLVSKQAFTKRYKSVRYHFYRRLRGRHLCRMIQTFPVGRRLTTLIIDGTGVNTDTLKLALSEVEGTLRGISAKWCRHIECYMWSEWILEAMHRSTPFALQWLNVYGSGNTPISDFRWDEFPDQLTPLRRHPCDPVIPGELPARLSDWKPKPNLFANMIPFEFHFEHTMALITPHNLNTLTYWSFLHASRQTIGLQREVFLKSNPRPALWNPPLNSTLRDPHPLIALLSVAKFKKIELDICYCMNGRRCYSFLYGRPAFMNVNQTNTDQPAYHVTVTDSTSGLPRRFTPTADSLGGGMKLHTHCVAEVGKRREDGGGACANCGLWEDKLAEEKHRGATPARNIGGVLTGDSIGVGRISVGNLCLECTTNMTCVSCNAFYCNSCLFRTIPQLPPIPTAIEPPDPEFLHMICSKSVHGPYCRDCLDIYTSTCVDCDEKMCTKCLTPNGLAISTNIFGRALDLDRSYGVTYHARMERTGNYSSWDKMISGKDSVKPDYFEAETDSEADGGSSFGESGSSLGEDSDGYGDEYGEGPAGYPGNFVSGAGGSGQNYAESSSLPASWHSNSSFRERGGPPHCPVQDRNSGPRRPTSSLRLGHLIHDPRIILSTRITEKCSGCDDLLCSFCLNYDADPGAEIFEASEYQSCAGECGLRICKPCLHGDEFVMVWCYEQCGAWLCPLCTYAKQAVRYVCHPGGRQERWGWGRGDFLPFRWWTCRYAGVLDCNPDCEVENDDEPEGEDGESGGGLESKGDDKFEGGPGDGNRFEGGGMPVVQ